MKFLSLINVCGALALLAAPGVAQTPGSLTTLFASNNGYAGNMFDITPTVNMTFSGVDINCTSAGTAATISVWYKIGTSVGFESNAAAWTFLGSFAGVSAGQDLPTFMNMRGNAVTFMGGVSYGFYINLTSYGAQTLQYTNSSSGGTLFSNADLSLLTNAGKGVGFGGPTYRVRDWNGTLYYDTQGGGGGGLALTVAGVCPGQMTLTVVGGTSRGTMAMAYGRAGSFTIPSGPCAGVVLGISNPTLAVTLFADGAGFVSMTTNIPSGACGLSVQAVDMTSCTATNTVVL